MKRKKNDAPPVEKRGDGVVARNKRAGFEYELGERFEAGLALAGSEVKVLRGGSADLSDAYIRVEHGEAWVIGLNIPVLPGAAFGGHQPKRRRKLLLHASEIQHLQRATEREGMTAVATQIYFRGGRAKLELALAKGKRMGDKRETVRAREAEREAKAAIDRAVERRRR